MIKFLKIYRGLKLLILNAIHFRLILVGLKLSFLLLINIFTKFLFLKLKNKKIIYDFFNYTKKFKLSQNYFKHNPPIWFEIFKKNNLLNKDINILEIGSFEGMSILFFDKFIENCLPPFNSKYTSANSLESNKAPWRSLSDKSILNLLQR